MQLNSRVVEVTGKTAKTFGNVLVPAGGKVHIKINNDLIQATVKSGFVETEVWIRAQNIDSVELFETPIYLLLGFGILMGLFALGNLIASAEYIGSLVYAIVCSFISGICIWISIKHKRRFLIIHSTRNIIAVFMNKPVENYRQFAINVIFLARHLNARAPIQTSQSQMQQVNRQRTMGIEK